VWTVYDVARRLGVEKALGTDRAGKLALWQVISRVIKQGSRLGAVRLAATHAAADVLGLERGFDENDLYKNLAWLSENQEKIEKRLFRARRGRNKPELFLYDVTSSYLEGLCNELSNWGYNRDGKKGKQQIVIGLLCDEAGEPVATQVFGGNTQDTATFGSQIKKVASTFGCQRVTFVGDRGMIKGPQIADLEAKEDFHYITAITKAQIQTMLKSDIFQLSLFDENLAEVEEERIRYILRRNPQRAEEIQKTRQGKQAGIERLLDKQNEYLAGHPKARVKTAKKKVSAKIEKLKADKWLKVKVRKRRLSLKTDHTALKEISRLDGCYAIKTDLPKAVADKEIVHDRYKDLAEVETGFRTMKTGHLEVRPLYVRKETSTRGHVLVVMLAYLIIRELKRAWDGYDLTVEEGIEQLSTLCSMKVTIKGGGSYLQIPEPRDMSMQLLSAALVRLPEVLPHRKINVVSRRKLPSRRITK
jgi:transposase